jgi:hypothetical protein
VIITKWFLYKKFYLVAIGVHTLLAFGGTAVMTVGACRDSFSLFFTGLAMMLSNACFIASNIKNLSDLDGADERYRRRSVSQDLPLSAAGFQLYSMFYGVPHSRIRTPVSDTLSAETRRTTQAEMARMHIDWGNGPDTPASREARDRNDALGMGTQVFMGAPHSRPFLTDEELKGLKLDHDLVNQPPEEKQPDFNEIIKGALNERVREEEYEDPDFDGGTH